MSSPIFINMVALTDMTTKKLYEAGALVESKNSNGAFRVRIITEGVGSSGVYGRELLEKYREVFANRPMFANHPKDSEKPWERSIMEIKAKTGSSVDYDVVDGVAGLYTDAEVDDPKFAEFINKYRDTIGVSVYISGTGKEEDGQYIVESFDGEDPFRSVDFVVAAGRGGAVERMLEAYREIEASGVAPGNGPATAASQSTQEERKPSTMELSELASKIDTLVEAVTAQTGVYTALVESLKPEVKSEVDVAAVVESAYDASLTAKLPESMRKVVIEAAKSGGDIAAAVADQVKLRDEILAESKQERQVEGYVHGSASDDFTIAGMGGN